jgi:hypothetical protein
MMNLLKDKRKSICFDAFHVFKVIRHAPPSARWLPACEKWLVNLRERRQVFVQNPQKKATITGILAKNKVLPKFFVVHRGRACCSGILCVPRFPIQLNLTVRQHEALHHEALPTPWHLLTAPGGPHCAPTGKAYPIH